MGVCLRFDRARSPVGLFPMGSRNALPRSNPSRHGPTRPSRRGAFQRSPGAEPLQRTCLAVPGRDRACARPATASARALADSESRGTADASHGVAIGGARALDLPFRRDRGRGPRPTPSATPSGGRTVRDHRRQVKGVGADFPSAARGRACILSTCARDSHSS